MPDREIYDRVADMLRARERSPAPALLKGDETRIAAGVAVYRNNVRAGLSKALGEKFPVVRALVGDEFFKFAANEYFNMSPPVSPLLSDYGETFPDFLENFEPARKLAYLGDVARVECAWLAAYRAADAAPLGSDAIMAAAGDDPSALRFTMHPSLRLRRSPFAAGSIWLRHKQGAAQEKIAVDRGECIMIVRPHAQVDLRIIDESAFAALQRLAAGETVGGAFEHAAKQNEAFDPQAVFRLIFESGAVVAVN